ncbi:hypothetical protein [Natronorubrum thiooxidans]|uniref:Uncharacterized protein n=1 Tax=Natronorubrum thiooxidans TaxID=308853 RepID=A0A1N7GDS3_9EURY|nr:hypothetical protein [Natronorubrum thiooxidans]SIS10723.1 hypothetical protein SAMN05421752_111107 [Natronorubrum thiooxidans]
MRALRTCDFCGDDAAGTFEVIPPELEPTDTEQRRVVLCPDCKARLEGVLEPLFARLDSDRDVPGADTAVDHSDDQPSQASGRDEDGEPEAVDAEPGAVATAASSVQNHTSTSSPDTTSSDAEATDADARATPRLEEGITFESTGTDDNSEAVAEDETNESTDDTGASDSTIGASPSKTTGSRPPKGYGKVIRLLQNREFPMQRSAVEGLAAGAYDLESHEVDAIIDHALETEEFVERRGELQRP